MLKQLLRKDKSCHHFLCVLSLTWVSVLRSSNLESEVPRIKPANKLTKPIFNFTLRASQTLIDSQHLLFHLHSFCCLPSLARCSSVPNIVFLFFIIGSLFSFLFTQQNEPPHISMQTTEMQFGGEIGEMKRVFQRAKRNVCETKDHGVKRVPWI